MSIKLLYSVFFGILAKVYDDVLDQKILSNPKVVHTIQSLIILFLTLIGYQDFYFAYACLFVICLNSGFDHPFWNSFLPVMIVLFLTGAPYGGDRIPLKLVLATLAVLTILFFAYLEELYYPEEYSWRKVVSRIIGSGVFLGVGLVLSDIPYMPRFGIEPIKKTCFIMVGYLITSIILQVYALLEDEDAGAALGFEKGLGRGASEGAPLGFEIRGAKEEEEEDEEEEEAKEAETSSGTTAPVSLSQP
jgi:hypothetical protein